MKWRRCRCRQRDGKLQHGRFDALSGACSNPNRHAQCLLQPCLSNTMCTRIFNSCHDLSFFFLSFLSIPCLSFPFISFPDLLHVSTHAQRAHDRMHVRVHRVGGPARSPPKALLADGLGIKPFEVSSVVVNDEGEASPTCRRTGVVLIMQEEFRKRV